eukprot:m.721548 g.721548  ORF g.721548 m.721548 type:complete len:51 (-) comp23014_c0_seq5:3511-3663(-)
MFFFVVSKDNEYFFLVSTLRQKLSNVSPSSMVSTFMTRFPKLFSRKVWQN